MKTVRIFMTAQKILFHALRTSVFATELTHDLSAKNRSIMIGTDTAYFFFDPMCSQPLDEFVELLDSGQGHHVRITYIVALQPRILIV